VLKIVLKTMKWSFIVFCVYVASLFFRQERISGKIVEHALASQVPSNLVVSVDSLAFGFRHGFTVEGFRVYDREKPSSITPVASADSVHIDFLKRNVRIEGARYPRLPDSYYAPGNQERNSRIEAKLPELPKFMLTLVRAEILSLAPQLVTAEVVVKPARAEFGNVTVEWARSESKVEGFCYIDFDDQILYGEVEGLATQAHIRPMIDTLDVPVALAYMDEFTEVPSAVPAWCSWKVNLVNNDFDLKLKLKPALGKYNSVPMRKADGFIHLHSYTRGDCLNYRTVIGPVKASDTSDRPLEGTITVVGTNNYNVVDVSAKSAMPLADVIKIAGFEGDYVDGQAIGKAQGELQFRFPRAMSNNYEVLNGHGSLKFTEGRLARIKLFAGLTELLADKVPGVSFIVDQSEASLDYVIENGVIKTDNVCIEGGLFSIRMRGSYDTVKDNLDFVVRVQFIRRDTLMGKLVNPIFWPFSKLLMEFKLLGSVDDPKWEYLSIVVRILEVAK
jgi:hypothetical protein